MHGENGGSLSSGCRSGFEVLMALVVGQNKGAKRWWEKKREVSGREDGVRSNCVTLANLIPSQSIHGPNCGHGRVSAESCIIEMGVPEFRCEGAWRKVGTHVLRVQRRQDGMRNSMSQVSEETA